jgi:nucleotide-binding universal stress UspA family protein
MNGIRRILLPTRFSALSRAAAPYVELLSTSLDAEVHLVHVVPHTTVAPSSGPLGLDPAVAIPLMEPTTDEAERQLALFATQLLPRAPRVRTAAVFGGIVDELVRYAGAHAIELIVMGTHADGVLKRLVFGSIGRAVLEAAPCPVMLVPVRGAPR